VESVRENDTEWWQYAVKVLVFNQDLTDSRQEKISEFLNVQGGMGYELVFAVPIEKTEFHKSPVEKFMYTLKRPC